MEVGERVSKICNQHFNSIAKNGKPGVKQWTVMAAAVQEDTTADKFTVVAMATGTSCLGASEMQSSGTVVHDNHAEVLARRCLQRYFYAQLELLYTDQPSILELESSGGKSFVQSNFIFHFFSTQTPCGDASIYNKPNDKLPDENEPKSKYRKLEEHCDKEIKDINRTGAKPVNGETPDSMGGGFNYHTTCSLRIKPGRGERTESMSCSDKIMKWGFMGVQGALLSVLLPHPVYFESITIESDSDDDTSIKRAIFQRFDVDKVNSLLNGDGYLVKIPKIYLVKPRFKYSIHNIENTVDSKPCGSSITWFRNKSISVHEVIDKRGFKLGCTNKTKHLPKSLLQVCRYKMLETFLSTVKMLPNHSTLGNLSHCKTYHDFKKLAVAYISNWNLIKNEIFKNWSMHDRKLDLFLIK